MIDFLNGLGSSWVGYFGPAVLQNTVFLGLIFLGLRALKNTRASLRYALCLIGFVKLLLPPFLPTGLLRTPDAVAPVVSLVSLSPGTLAPASPATGQGAGSGLGAPGLLFAAWLAVAVTYIAYTALTGARLRRELRRALPIGALKRGKGKGRQVEILKTDGIPVPLTFGLLQPRIYVPEAWEGWSEGCRRMVLAHELAHIRRWDSVGQAIQALLKALYFFHPLVWLLDSRMNEYREMACDDEATERSSRKAVDYSRHLVEIAEGAVLGRLSCRSVSAILKHRRGLLRRVRYQLEVKNMKTMSGRTKAVVVGGVLLLVLPLSWYCGKAETEEVKGMAGGATIETQGPMKEVSIVLMPDGKVNVEGEVAALEDLSKTLEAKFPSGRDRVLVRLSCEDGVPMGWVPEIHAVLVGLDLRKVVYEIGSEEGLPLILPSLDNQDKLARLDKEDVAVVKVDLPGLATLDGRPIKITAIKDALKARLDENPHLVVSLVWAPTAKYEDFIMVMGLVKAAGARRIAVGVGL